jgi:hypothetical protein
VEDFLVWKLLEFKDMLQTTEEISYTVKNSFSYKISKSRSFPSLQDIVVCPMGNIQYRKGEKVVGVLFIVCVKDATFNRPP